MTFFQLQESVFDAHDLGLQTLAEIEGRAFQPYNRKATKRRKAVAEAIRTLGVVTACKAVRNLPLSAYHRGENDKKTRYLDIEYALRRPEAFAELFAGPDENLADAIRKSLKPSNGAGYHHPEGVTQGVVEWE